MLPRLVLNSWAQALKVLAYRYKSPAYGWEVLRADDGG